MKIITLLSFILLFGCKSEVVMKTEKSYSIDPKAESFVNAFYNDSIVRGLNIPKNLILTYSSTDPKWNEGVVGYCLLTEKNARPPKIVINENFWSGATTYEKYMLVYHELGHCLLNRGHRTIVDYDYYRAGITIPFSYMYPYIIRYYNATVYNFAITNRQYYVEELFDQSQIYAFSSLGTLYDTNTSSIVTNQNIENSDIPEYTTIHLMKKEGCWHERVKENSF